MGLEVFDHYVCDGQMGIEDIAPGTAAHPPVPIQRDWGPGSGSGMGRIF